VPQNSGTGQISAFYGIKGLGAYYNSGFGGSPSTGAMESPPLQQVNIVPVYQSSQGALDSVTVDVGDTFSASGDKPVIETFLTPPMADITGMGKGHVI